MTEVPDVMQGGARPGSARTGRIFEDGIDLLELLIVLAKQKNIVLGLPVAAAVLSTAVTLLMPNIYTGTARILPPQQNQSSAAAVLGQLGMLSGVAANSLGIKNPSDLYIGMLKSRSIGDPIIVKFKLQELFEADTVDEAQRELAEVTTITAGKDGIITIEVDDQDPKRAAEIANAYIEQLELTNERLAVTEAAQRRLFFEKQLRHQKDALASAEVELKKMQEKTGLIKLDEQGKAIIEAVANVRAQIASKEVQIGAMRSFTTGRNPERIRAEAELSGLREQLGKLEQNTAIENSTFLPTGRVPAAGLEFVRKLRDVKYHEALFELFSKQYELARLDESKDASLIQVLDRAVPPELKSKPRRGIIVVLSTCAAGFLAVFLAVLKEAFGRAQADPIHEGRLNALRSNLLLPWRPSSLPKARKPSDSS